MNIRLLHQDSQSCTVAWDEVPGACARDCGNYLDMNLPMANYYGARYVMLLEAADETRLTYPE